MWLGWLCFGTNVFDAWRAFDGFDGLADLENCFDGLADLENMAGKFGNSGNCWLG